MNKDNKNRVKKGLEVLLLVLGLSFGVGAGIGCFNYATLAKQAGDNENIFWIVGIVNIVYWLFYGIRRIKQFEEE